MSDVMTKEERELVEALRSFGAFAGSPASDHFEAAAKSVVALCDRLASEVERLRDRNERLEAVAKAARSVCEWQIEDLRLPECWEAPDGSSLVKSLLWMQAALSALKEEGK